MDTSVWIRFLADEKRHSAELDRLLSLDEVSGHPLIFGELLIGDRGGRAGLLSSYRQMSQLPSMSHLEVVELVRARRLSGRGIGWIDAHLLASAIVHRHALWTADARLGELAVELGVAHRV